MKLILLANGFPYGGWEPFLETETRYYGAFEAVHVFSMQLRRSQRTKRRALPDGRFFVHPVPFAPLPVYFFAALGDKNLRAECRRLRAEGRLTLSRLAWLVFYLGRARHEARVIRRALRREGLLDGGGEDCLVYSYRFDYQPYAALLLRESLPGCRIVARAHGYDLYEYVRGTDYIPLRPYLLERLHHVFLISDHGRRYLEERYPGFAGKLSVSRLGTLDHGVCPASLDGGPLRLVSCSAAAPVKRLPLLVDALALLTDRAVEWTHYGDGAQLDEVRARCEALPANIRWRLAGQLDNAALMDVYAATPYHLFVNVSASEGVPVSIMEAMSFGIPCLATDVGGTAELVRDGVNGALLPADTTAERIADGVRAFADMEEPDYQRLRAGARDFWRAHYDAEKNYAAFAGELAAWGEGRPWRA